MNSTVRPALLLLVPGFKADSKVQNDLPEVLLDLDNNEQLEVSTAQAKCAEELIRKQSSSKLAQAA